MKLINYFMITILPIYMMMMIKSISTNPNFLGLTSLFATKCKSNLLYCNKNNYFNHKHPSKMICISPGGLNGFYITGVVAYIKENYDTSDYFFSGASAGAWNSLLFTYKGNVLDILHIILGAKNKITQKEKISDFEINLKNRILDNFRESDFELDRIYIGVTTLRPSWKYTLKSTDKFLYNNNKSFFLKTNIFYNFDNLADVIDCCVASSHIPLVTGGLINKYKNFYTFDGGFSRYPYYDIIKPDLIITPNMWKKNKIPLEEYSTFLFRERYDFYKLYEQGYNDTRDNREFLDKILPRKIT